MTAKTITIANLEVSNEKPFTLFAGMNVLESRELALKIAEEFKLVTDELKLPFVFKASFDKANRSSINSFRGPGLDEGLKWLAEIKETFGVPIITDVHTEAQANAAAEVADVIQLPAFLSRQTDLVMAMAKTGAVINIKKAQFLAPQEMRHILKKFEDAGNDRLLLCERGSSFGYNNLVVDMLGFSVMKKFGYPLLFDATHALHRTEADSRIFSLPRSRAYRRRDYCSQSYCPARTAKACHCPRLRIFSGCGASLAVLKTALF